MFIGKIIFWERLRVEKAIVALLKQLLVKLVMLKELRDGV